MYNLLVGLTGGEVRPIRFLTEHTEKHLQDYFALGVGQVRVDRLLTLPTIFMPEIGFGGEQQVAHVGHVADVRKSGDVYRFSFVPNPAIAPIPLSRVEEAAGALGIDDVWELRRTHWAVKDVDLYRVLDRELSARVKPKVLKLPTSEAFDPSLVAVMMPFSPAYTSVFEALQKGIEMADMHCLRADDIWEKDHILDDVLSLIWRARVVISDLSEKNANVFYETGIAHAIGRDTILVAQSKIDIPFDLQSIRASFYLNNGEGLAKLSREIASRLRTIVQS